MQSDNISQCVDWRTLLADNTNWMSVPWASVWQLAIILAVIEELIWGADVNDVHREELYTIFIALIWGIQNFNYHIDQHAVDHNKKNPNKFKHWCGHIWLLVSAENRQEYWLTVDSANFIEKKVLENINSKNIVNLQWNHEELWVAIISSEKYTISPNHDGKQFFVYNQWASHKFFRRIAWDLKNKYPNLDIDLDVLTETFNIQMDRSAARTVLKLTGKKDFPLYIINHDSRWKIDEIQNIILTELYTILWMKWD